MTQIGRKIFPTLAATLIVAGCQTLPHQQGPAIAPASAQTVQSGYEQAGYINAADFLPPTLMQSALHTVSPQAYNDGFANTYRIETADYVYVVQGTDNAIKRIDELEAIEKLKRRSTVGTSAIAVGERTFNLVETPFRAVRGVATRVTSVDNPGQAIMSIPSGAAEIIGTLGHGIGQMGVTAARITTGAAGTKCQGLGGCVSKAGEDIWSGVNSLAGKHAAAQEIHAELGTDPYTENKVLQRQVDRLSYADAYVSTAVKIGYTWSGVRILDPLATGVGYYNNGEFLAQYEDAHKNRNKEKALMTSWGVDADTVNALYKSKIFTHTSRTRLAQALSQIGTPPYRAKLIEQASASKTRFVAESRLSVFEYLASLEADGRVNAYIPDAPSAIGVTPDGVLILPFAADYLQWTPEIAGPIQNFAAQAPGKTEIHVIGQASPLFKQNAQKHGIQVTEIR